LAVCQTQEKEKDNQIADWKSKIEGVKKKLDEVVSQKEADEKRKAELSEKQTALKVDRDNLKELKFIKVLTYYTGNHKARK
jgi:hypothetical protein